MIEGAFHQRRLRRMERRIQAARLPVLKILEPFRWDWPKKINRLQVRHLLGLEFLAQKANAIFLGTVGLGNTHRAIALGYAACLEDYSVVFPNAMSLINDLSAARTQGRLKTELEKYLRPQLLVLDEVGYLPIDQRGADLLFQVISQRCERGSIVLATRQAEKSQGRSGIRPYQVHGEGVTSFYATIG